MIAREDEIDDLLRDEVFVDLYRVVQQSLRVGIVVEKVCEKLTLTAPRLIRGKHCS